MSIRGATHTGSGPGLQLDVSLLSLELVLLALTFGLDFRSPAFKVPAGIIGFDDAFENPPNKDENLPGVPAGLC